MATTGLDMRTHCKIENSGVAFTRHYVSMAGTNTEAETGFEHVPEVLVSGFLLDWLAGSDLSEDGKQIRDRRP